MKVSTKALIVILILAYLAIFGALDLLPWQWEQIPEGDAP